MPYILQVLFLLSPLLAQQKILLQQNQQKSILNSSTEKVVQESAQQSLAIDTIISPVESIFARITGKHTLRQIGYDLFKIHGAPAAYVQNVPSEYILGPGDEVVFYMSGNIENAFTSTIDKSGMVYIQGLGPIRIAGMSLKEAERHINELARAKWSNVKITLSPGRIKGIKVFLTGEVRKPGVYLLKANSTILDLLFISGGILKTGSLRELEISRANGKSIKVDLYPFIFGGKPGHTILKEGDVIIVPPIRNVIAIEGGVYKPGIYETNQNTTISSLSKWAGLFPLFQKRAIIKRLATDSIHIFDVPYRDWKKFKLLSGDYITIPIPKLKSSGYIYIDGNIKKPGYYSFKKHLTLKKALNNAGGFLVKPYKDILIVRHKNLKSIDIMIPLYKTDSFTLKDKDSVLVFRGDIFSKKEPVSIYGYVKKPGIYQWHENLTLKSLLLLAKPRYDASLYNVIIYRHKNSTNTVIKRTSFEPTILKPGDVIFVPQDTLDNTRLKVCVKGAVKFPGVYTIPDGTSVAELIDIAGGFTNNAYKGGIYIIRHDGKVNQYERLSLFNILLSDTITSHNTDRLLNLLKGRILYRLPVTKNSLLKDMDTLNIPSVQQFVYIAGATVQPHSTAYRKGLTVKDVLKNTPLLNTADVKNAFAIGINGKVHTGEIQPGDIVYIPFKKETPHNFLKNVSLLTGIIYQITMSLFIIFQLKK